MVSKQNVRITRKNLTQIKMAKKLLKVIRNVCVIATIILVVLNLLSITKYSILTILLPIGFYIGCVTLLY